MFPLVKALATTEVLNYEGPTTIAFGSCYEKSKRSPAFDIFKEIHEQNPDIFVWHGDYAYVSLTERIRFKSFLTDPILLLKSLPKLALHFVLKAKYWVSLRTGHEKDAPPPITWA